MNEITKEDIVRELNRLRDEGEYLQVTKLKTKYHHLLYGFKPHLDIYDQDFAYYRD